ncbi:hypothetical protein B9T31_14880 [Acinetobacter sp. ANC 4558]|nr:hypothetical protein B9T31_14880 [Acinetobacter sp. ANC 4558]
MNFKKIYFTDDFSTENIEKLQSDGWVLRKASAVKEGDFIEQADEYGGEVPSHYKSQNQQIAVSLNAEIAPELQQAIDDAKAECVKVIAENVALKTDMEKVIAERDALKAQVVDLEAKVKKPTAAELKAAKAAEDAAKLEEPKE